MAWHISIVAVITLGAGFGQLILKFLQQNRAIQDLQKDLQGQLLKEEESRQAERAGRIRAERQLKVCKQQVSGSAADSSHETGSRTNLWIFKPLDLHQSSGSKGIKGKIKPPRLNGQKTGTLSTRTPHRPNPIGLSLCEVLEVSPSKLVLGGADIVDGSPVLDVKPYLPFCESIPRAVAPDWVQEATENEPLHVQAVSFTSRAHESMQQCWACLPHSLQQLVPDFQHLKTLAEQVLSRDIRSLHRRSSKADTGASHSVNLMGIQFEYTIVQGAVQVVSAVIASDLEASQRKLV